MSLIIKNLIFFIILTIISFSGFSQTIEKQVFSNSGGELKGSSSSIEYVIGETSVSTYATKNNSISEGFLQGYEIYPVPLSSGEDELSESISIKVYPNPTTDFINIETSDIDTYNYSVVDGVGKIVLEGASSEAIKSLEFKTLSTGVYHLLIFKEDKIVKKFKIIKTK